jgi:hypothetical protein
MHPIKAMKTIAMAQILLHSISTIHTERKYSVLLATKKDWYYLGWVVILCFEERLMLTLFAVRETLGHKTPGFFKITIS